MAGVVVNLTQENSAARLVSRAGQVLLNVDPNPGAISRGGGPCYREGTIELLRRPEETEEGNRVALADADALNDAAGRQQRGVNERTAC